MKYRHLGKAGIQVSELSFGSWVTFHNQSGVDKTVEMMAAAYDAGVNFFDNAVFTRDPIFVFVYFLNTIRTTICMISLRQYLNFLAIDISP